MASPAVEAAIRAIADRNAGRLTPEMVVQAARDKESPLHPFFTWDVKKAAQERLIDQARHLIRSVKVEVTTTQFSVRAPAYLRDPQAGGASQGYASLARLRNDEDMARDAVVNEFSRASSALSRAKAVAAALGLSDEIEEVRGAIVRLSERAQQTEHMASA